MVTVFSSPPPHARQMRKLSSIGVTRHTSYSMCLVEGACLRARRKAGRDLDVGQESIRYGLYCLAIYSPRLTHTHHKRAFVALRALGFVWWGPLLSLCVGVSARWRKTLEIFFSFYLFMSMWALSVTDEALTLVHCVFTLSEVDGHSSCLCLGGVDGDVWVAPFFWDGNTPDLTITFVFYRVILVYLENLNICMC